MGILKGLLPSFDEGSPSGWRSGGTEPRRNPVIEGRITDEGGCSIGLGCLGLLEELIHSSNLPKGRKPIRREVRHASILEGLRKVEVFIFGIRLFDEDALMTFLIGHGEVLNGLRQMCRGCLLGLMRTFRGPLPTCWLPLVSRRQMRDSNGGLLMGKGMQAIEDMTAKGMIDNLRMGSCGSIEESG